METMEKQVYPCKDATDNKISRLLLDTGLVGYRDSAKNLQDMTCPVSEAEIPWDTATHIGILGSGNPRCNDALEEAGMKPGVYTNRWGTWLILIHPEEADIQNAVDRCAGRLVSLEAYNTSIPELDVSACPRLEKLRVWDDERLLRILGLERMERLTILNLSACSGLRELPGLERLKQLPALYLSGCSGLTELPGLERLERLTRLDLSGCSGLTELPGLEGLEQLTELDLSRCIGLKELPGLERLEQLTELNLRGCSGLTELPEGIRELMSLRRLGLQVMKLSTLPDWLPEIAEGFVIENYRIAPGKQKTNVCLYGTTVEDMEDMSIFSQPYEVVAEWFKNRALGRTRPLNEIKVVFLGDGEAGKSLTIARLMNDGGDPKGYVNVRTPGIVIKDVEYPIGDRSATLHLWDFGGQDIMHSMHRIFLTERTIYVVLVDGSIGNQDERARYWLQNIRSFAKDAPIVLVLNKLDDGLQADVNAVDLYNKYKGLKQIIKLSALQYPKERFNREFKDVLLEEISKTGYLDAQWPISWIQVKHELEHMDDNYIHGSEYLKICKKQNVDTNQKNLLKWFHDLGISFCYCDDKNRALEDYVVLKPNWITNALYIILFNEREGGNGGLVPINTIRNMLSEEALNRDAIKRVIPDAYYAGYDVNYVLDVFHAFRLSFRKDEDHEFFPMLADVNAKPVAGEYAADKACLEFNMEFDYLPSNLLHRLMVERHTELDMDNVWRTGAKFQLKELGYSAVVVIDGNILRFFIRHTDPMHRPNTYLTMLNSNVDRIVEKMGLNPPSSQLIYKLDGRQDAFDYGTLKIMQEAGEKDIFSVTWRRRLLLRNIFNQSAPDGMANHHLLLKELLSSCGKMQDEPLYRLIRNPDGRGYANGSGMEDLRNRRLRDDLLGKDYRVADQTQRGTGRTGAGMGEVDLLLTNDRNEPWTIIEALRVTDGTKGDWNSHLDKLLAKYNTRGLPVLYLLTYVDADPTAFGNIWRGYQDHIRKYDPEKHIYCENSFTDLNDDSTPLYIKTAKCLYTSGDKPVTVYHIFARIPTQNE